jgi:nicotinamide-nucleotide amidase
MRAEIISTGTELLLGAIVDSNAAYISQRLAEIGIDLHFRVTVGDNEERIAHSISQALRRADVVICTGGLGPTVDDVTRHAVARATNRELVQNEKMLAWIEERFRGWGHEMSANNRRQALMPAGAIPIDNPVGTAPIFVVQDERGDVIVLPGVPHEMKHLMESEVIPYLTQKLGHTDVIKTRILRTVGIGESQVDARIGDLMENSNPTVGLAAHPGQTDVRIVAKAVSEGEADRLIADVESQVRARLGHVIYGVDKETVAEVVARMLSSRRLKLGLVECGTEGLVSRAFLETPDGPEALGDSFVLASPVEAADALGLNELHECTEGLLSPETALCAAHAGRETLMVDLCIAVWAPDTIADDPRDRQPMYIALDTGLDASVGTFQYGGHSDRARGWLVNRSLDMVRRSLL